MFKFKKGDRLITTAANSRHPLLKVALIHASTDEYVVWSRQTRFPLSRLNVETNYKLRSPKS